MIPVEPQLRIRADETRPRGVIFNIMRFSTRDGPGLRTTVFLKGCPLACLWCHNPESQRFEPEMILRGGRCIGCGDCLAACPQTAISRVEDAWFRDREKCLACGMCVEVCPAQAREKIGREYGVPEVIAEILKDRDFYEESGGGVTFSGGEPLAQPDFLEALLWACKREDIRTAVDTSGAAPFNIFERVLPAVDLFLYDLKLMNEAEHFRLTGMSNKVILENLRRLDAAGAKTTIRVPMVPSLTDTTENLEAMGEFVANLASLRYIVLLPYHEIGAEKYRHLGRSYGLNLETPTAEDMQGAADILSRYGLTVTIGG